MEAVVPWKTCEQLTVYGHLHAAVLGVGLFEGQVKELRLGLGRDGGGFDDCIGEGLTLIRGRIAVHRPEGIRLEEASVQRRDGQHRVAGQGLSAAEGDGLLAAIGLQRLIAGLQAVANGDFIAVAGELGIELCCGARHGNGHAAGSVFVFRARRIGHSAAAGDQLPAAEGVALFGLGGKGVLRPFGDHRAVREVGRQGHLAALRRIGGDGQGVLGFLEDDLHIGIFRLGDVAEGVAAGLGLEHCACFTSRVDRPCIHLIARVGAGDKVQARTRVVAAIHQRGGGQLHGAGGVALHLRNACGELILRAGKEQRAGDDLGQLIVLIHTGFQLHAHGVRAGERVAVQGHLLAAGILGKQRQNIALFMEAARTQIAAGNDRQVGGVFDLSRLQRLRLHADGQRALDDADGEGSHLSIGAVIQLNCCRAGRLAVPVSGQAGEAQAVGRRNVRTAQVPARLAVSAGSQLGCAVAVSHLGDAEID